MFQRYFFYFSTFILCAFNTCSAHAKITELSSLLENSTSTKNQRLPLLNLVKESNLESIHNTDHSSCIEINHHFCRKGARGPKGKRGPSGGANFNNYASALSTSTVSNGVLVFQTPLAISGMSYDQDLGIFTVPVDGVYHIQIGSQLGLDQDPLPIFSLLINDIPIGISPFYLPFSSLVIIQSIEAQQSIKIGVIDNRLPASFKSCISIAINQIN